MRTISSLGGVRLRDRIKSEEISKKWNVEEITDDIKNYQLKWNQNVLKMLKNRIPRKAMQYRPQGESLFRKTLSQLEIPVRVVAEQEL